MFVLLVNYTSPLDQIDPLIPAHNAYLDANYQAGVFIASGRRIPRTGGVILASATTEEELRGIIAADPFVTAGVAEYAVIAFAATKYDPRFAVFVEKEASAAEGRAPARS